jgi:hypothetical protein
VSARRLPSRPRVPRRVRGEFRQTGTALVRVHPVDPLDHRRDDTGNLVAVLAELGVLAHQRPQYRPDLCLAPVFHRVVQRVDLGLALDTLAYVLVHYRALLAPR